MKIYFCFLVFLKKKKIKRNKANNFQNKSFLVITYTNN